MSEPDNFLSRWSRRKRATTEANSEPETPVVARAAAVEGEAQAPAVVRAPEASVPAPSEPAFDPGSLPPIESIGAETDVSAFLKPGVPSALRHAALRRVWSADPAIRNFKGLAENDWDFNDPNAMPGFGALDPDFDVGKMVARVFGEDRSSDMTAPEPLPAADEQPVLASQQMEAETAPDLPADTAAAETSQVESCDLEKKLVQREENIALQQDEVMYPNGQNKLRRHGGALPHVFPEY